MAAILVHFFHTRNQPNNIQSYERKGRSKGKGRILEFLMCSAVSSQSPPVIIEHYSTRTIWRIFWSYSQCYNYCCVLFMSCHHCHRQSRCHCLFEVFAIRHSRFIWIFIYKSHKKYWNDRNRTQALQFWIFLLDNSDMESTEAHRLSYEWNADV